MNDDGGGLELPPATETEHSTTDFVAAPDGTVEAPEVPPVPPTDNRVSSAMAFRVGLFGAFGVAIVYALYLSLATVMSMLIVLAISVVLAIGLDPLVTVLMRRGLNRGLAVTATFVALLAFLFGALYVIIPPIATQIGTLIKNLPDLLDVLLENRTIRSLDEKFGLIEKVQTYAADMGPGAATGVFTAAGIAIDLLIVLILTLYFMAGLPNITAAAYRLVPASRRHRVRELGDRIIKQMGGYLAGAFLIALQAGVVAGVFAWAVGLPYPFAIAAAAMVLDFVPVVGPIIIGVSMALLGFTQSLVIGLVALGFYVCQHLFEAYWLYPRVMRRTVQISSAAVIVAILIGSALLGVVGAVLAVPVAAAIQLIIREVLIPRQQQN